MLHVAKENEFRGTASSNTRSFKDNATCEYASISRYLAEARAVADLEHPAIVPVHDFGVTGDGPWSPVRPKSASKT
jgi:hypothetical protein